MAKKGGRWQPGSSKAARTVPTAGSGATETFKTVPRSVLEREEDHYNAPISIPAGRPMGEVRDAIERALVDPSTRAEREPIPTHHGWGRSDIPQTGLRSMDERRIRRQLPPSIPDVTRGASPAANLAAGLMSGNQDAVDFVSEELQRQQRERYEAERAETSVADRFMADSENIARGLWGLHGKPEKQFNAMIERYRNEVRRAHRFALDDDFVRMATAVSSTTQPRQLLYRLQFSLLPYELTWMEFDPRVKMNAIHRLRGVPDRSIEGVPDRMGILLYRINDTDWLMQLFAGYPFKGRELVMPHLTCYFVSTVERDFAKNDALHFGATPMVLLPATTEAEMHTVQPSTLAEIATSADDPRNLSKGCMWGYGTGPIGIIDSMDRFESLMAPSFLARHGDSGQSRHCKTLYEVIDNEAIKKNFGEMVQAELAEFGGFVRWVITVLAMMSEIPYRVEHRQPVGQFRVGLTGRKRYLDYHRLTLRIPKTRPVEYIERKLRNIVRRHRAHEVLSHWRNYLSAHPCSRETHEWEYDYPNGYRLCGKCMSESTRVKDHVRGNPELGWVKKEYVVKKEDK